MDSLNQYHPDDDVSRSLAVLFAFSSISVLLLFIWDVASLLVKTGESLTIGPSKMLMLLWHVVCLTFGLSAIVYMFRMKTGHMIVRSHEQKADILIHPLRIKKFVTFSSWTLILNVLYFSFATLASILVLFETSLPTWLLQSLGSIFVTALGASFLHPPQWFVMSSYLETIAMRNITNVNFGFIIK